MCSSKTRFMVVCPVLNERDNIPFFFSQISDLFSLYNQIDYRIVFADNCSTDDTETVIKSLNNEKVCYLRYSKNVGVMKSIYSALTIFDSDWFIVLDADLQEPISLVRQMIEKACDSENTARVIYGIRIDRSESRILTWARRLFRRLESLCQGARRTIESGAWCLDRRVVEQMQVIGFDPYLPGLISRVGFRSYGIEYAREKRVSGVSKFNMLKYFGYAKDGVISGSIVPLRLSFFVAILLFGVCGFLGSFFVVDKLFLGGDFADGVAATIVITLFGFALNFAVLAVISEYIGRIYMLPEIKAPVVIDCVEVVGGEQLFPLDGVVNLFED